MSSSSQSICRNCQKQPCECSRASSSPNLLAVAGVSALLGAAAMGFASWMSSEKDAQQQRQQVTNKRTARLQGEENKRLRLAVHREREAREKAEQGLTKDKQLLCCICMEVPPEVVVAPCNHASTCEKCAADLERCPICRGRIDNRTRIYL
eukprot:GHVS01064000.1.p1 GENE.GHVS01064000.1~~GHVS01064000.1.p1  ORF type:complete len:151 (+),score=15.87 GHVS01064000.1:52-504(+)